MLILTDEYDLSQCQAVRSPNCDTFVGASTEEDLQPDVQETELDDVSYLLYTSGELSETSVLCILIPTHERYTKGTTGKPKGCLLTHRGVYHALVAMTDLPRPVTNSETDKRLAMACRPVSLLGIFRSH